MTNDPVADAFSGAEVRTCDQLRFLRTNSPSEWGAPQSFVVVADPPGIEALLPGRLIHQNTCPVCGIDAAAEEVVWVYARFSDDLSIGCCSMIHPSCFRSLSEFQGDAPVPW